MMMVGYSRASAAAIPDMFSGSDWELENPATDGDIFVKINNLPADNGSAIYLVEYRLVSGGGWVTAPGLTSFTVSGVANDVSEGMQIRAKNSIGDGPVTAYSYITPSTAGFISGSDEYPGTPGHPYTTGSITFPSGRIAVPFFMVGNAVTTTLSSVTIKGVAATVQIFQANLEFVCGIADAVVTAGAGTIVFNASDSNDWKRAMAAAYKVGNRVHVNDAVDSAADPLTLDMNTVVGDLICGCAKLNDAGRTGFIATGGWSKDGGGNLEVNRWGAFFSDISVAGGTPEAFGIDENVTMDNGVAALYR